MASYRLGRIGPAGSDRRTNGTADVLSSPVVVRRRLSVPRRKLAKKDAVTRIWHNESGSIFGHWVVL